MYDNPHMSSHAPFAKPLLAAHLLRLQDTMIMMMPGSKGLLPPTDAPVILHHAHKCKSEPYYKI